MLRLGLVVLAALLLTACDTPQPKSSRPDTPVAGASVRPAGLPSPEVAAQNFVTVVERVEPVAEALCRQQVPRLNCDLQILVDSRTDQPPNAFQTQLKDGSPVIAFTIALIAQARNQDELAFIMGHEASHHIAGHMGRARQSAAEYAVLAGALAEMRGANREGVLRARIIGAQVGARTYSKEFELEADALGTLITLRAGYDPIRGAAYFARIPDPGNVFLGSHPPNAARVETVRRTVAGL